MTNMLGRKALSNNNALFGKNLNIIPADYFDANTGQKKEKWKLLDITNTLNTTIITGSVQNLLIHTHEQILNTGKIVDNKLVNYPAYLYAQPKHAYELSIDSQLIYYAIQRGNTKGMDLALRISAAATLPFFKGVLSKWTIALKKKTADTVIPGRHVDEHIEYLEAGVTLFLSLCKSLRAFLCSFSLEEVAEEQYLELY